MGVEFDGNIVNQARSVVRKRFDIRK